MAVFVFLTPFEGSAGGQIFPYMVYLSSNALFPLMALFVLIKPEEYHNYLPLYMAGKVIGAVLFFVWEFYLAQLLTGMENNARNLFFLGGSAFLSLTDIFSVCVAWTLKNKFRKVLGAVPESGGI